MCTEHGSLNLNWMALLTFSRSESISEVLNVVVIIKCSISSLLRFDKETCDQWLNRSHGDLPQVSLRMALITKSLHWHVSKLSPEIDRK